MLPLLIGTRRTLNMLVLVKVINAQVTGLNSTASD